MGSRSGRAALAVIAVASSVWLSGCCSIARGFCPVEPALVGHTRLTRDTPQESLDYLIAGVDDRRVADIFDCLHPDFIARHGGFNLAEFTSAFDHFEDSFREDAENLRRASRTESREGGLALVTVRRGDMSGVIVFKRRDVAFVRTTDDFVPESRAVVPPIGSLIRNDGGALLPSRAVRFDGLDGVDPDAILRLEYRREWLVHELRDVHGVNLVDRINERF